MSTHLHHGTRLGEYRLAELVGAGGMGQVYRAVHERLGREVAIKILADERMDAETIARFENEARIHCGLQHAQIATLYDVIAAGGRHALVMEFVAGETLGERLQRRGRLNVDEALAIVRQVASAVAYLHERGIVHRDLKPSNIRIRPDGAVKVLDFGIAQGRQSPGLTAAGGVVGTPEYLSPEQLKTGKATPRSDVWALGVLLFEMLTGRVPFAGAHPSQVWAAMQRGQGRPDGVPRTGRDARLDEVLARSLAMAAAARYASAGALLSALDSATAPQAAPRAHTRRAVWTACFAHAPRRWAWLAAAAALVSVLALAGAALDRPAAPRPIEGPRTAHVIDVTEGAADVYVNGARLGRTPLEYRAAPGEVVALELRQAGFAPRRARFAVTERRVWTFAMQHALEGR